MLALANHFTGRDLFYDMFSVWTLPETDINNFTDFAANSFNATIKFSLEPSSKKIVFLDTKVFKGPRFIQSKILVVQTHFKSTRNIPIHAFILMKPSQR